MRIAERVKTRMETAPKERGFVPGPAVVRPHDATFGVSGEQFSPDKYGEYLATSNSVYSIVTQRADQLASLPLRLYRIDKSERSRFNSRQLKAKRRRIMHNLAQVQHLPTRFKRAIDREGLEEVNTGPLFDLLQKVNEFWTMKRLITLTEMSLGAWGRSYWFLERGSSGLKTPTEIWWARPDLVKPVPDKEKFLSGYLLESASGVLSKEIPFKTSEVIWLYYPNPLDPYSPLSPMAAARVYADHENASMIANLNLHRQGLQMGGVVWPKGGEIWSPEQVAEIEYDLNRRFRGVSKAHRWGIFRSEVEMREAGITPDDIQFSQGMTMDLEAIARAYKWPLDLVGGRRTYENVDAAMVAAYVFAILPEATFIASELVEQLIPMFPGEADLILFDPSEVHVLQEAENDKWNREKEQLAQGAITINEWRTSKGLDTLPWGDVWWAPGNIIPVSDEAPVMIEGSLAGDMPLLEDDERQGRRLLAPHTRQIEEPDNVDQYQAAIADLIERAQAGEVDQDDFEQELRELIIASLLAIFLLGLGLSDDDDLTDEELTALRAETDLALSAVPDLANDVYEGRFDPEADNPLNLTARLALWAGFAAGVFWLGFMRVRDGDDEFLQWLWNPLKDHCRDCRRLNGQVHTRREWRESGYQPRGRSLECTGLYCGCRFARSQGPAVGEF